MKPKILVTSAAGHTGAATVKQLLDMGFAVRAFVRRQDARSEALKSAGAEIFVGDLFDFRDLRQALVGIQRAYHCPPFQQMPCTAPCCLPLRPKRRNWRWWRS